MENIHIAFEDKWWEKQNSEKAFDILPKYGVKEMDSMRRMNNSW